MKIALLTSFGLALWIMGCSEPPPDPESEAEAADAVVVEEGADAVYFIAGGPAAPSSRTPGDTSEPEDSETSMDASDVPVEDSDAPSDGDSIEDTAESEDTSPSDAGEGDPLGDAGEPIPPACPEGAYCDDENPCTLEDKCQADGSCVGTAKTCDDTNPCTEDLCDPEDGSCSNNPLSGVPCGLGQECLAGNCEQICEDGTVGSCPVVWEGDALVTDEESLSALSSITHIEGNLSISFYDGILTLPALQSVEGYLVLASTANVSGLNLPALKSVTGAFHLQGGEALNSINVPELESVQGGVRMENLTTLLSFSMPLLESLGGGLFVLKNTKLESIEMSSMAGPIPKMIVSENPKLPQCAVYALKDQLLPEVQDITSGNCDSCSCSSD